MITTITILKYCIYSLGLGGNAIICKICVKLALNIKKSIIN